MNSLKKGEGVPLLNFEGDPGILLWNFEGGTGVPLLNFRGVPGPTFKLWGRSRGPGPTFTPCLNCQTLHQPNHPQATHKPVQPPTNKPNHSETSQIPNKSPTNQQKIALFFPWKHFLWTATFSLPISREKRNRCIFLMFLLDFAFPILHSTVLYHP